MFNSAENLRVKEFFDLDGPWLDAVSGDPELPSADRLADLAGAFTAQFGLCELYDRTNDRLVRAGDRKRAEAHADYSMRHQERGLDYLGRAMGVADGMAGEVSALDRRPSARAGAEALAGFREEFMLLIADSELKAKDVTRIEEVYDEAAKAIAEGQNIGEWLGGKLKDLDEARRSEDRGNRDNLPWWKIVIIAVYVGLSAWKIWRCVIRDRCSRGEKAAYQAAAVILGISLKFC